MDRDTSILYHILRYCQLIEKSIERFGDDCEIFKNDEDYHSSVCMHLLQIGELVRKFSENFIKTHEHDIPWQQIRALRNICAHEYLKVNFDAIFATAHFDVKELKEFCEAQLAIIEGQ